MSEEKKYDYTPLPEPVLVTELNWPEHTQPLVCVRVMVYNHEKYIRECLDSVLMQKTTFPVWIVVHDDASTDSSPEILREYEAKYPGVLKVIYQKENTFSKPNKIELRRDLTLFMREGKYNAICEGDDYWTDPLKLQKQSDILEAHPGYSLVCGGYSEFYEHSGERRDILHRSDNSSHPNQNDFEITTEMFLRKWYVQTLTIMYRNGVISKEIQQKYQYFRDAHLQYYLLKSGKGYYISELLGVYRRHDGGIYSQIGAANQQLGYYRVYTELNHYHPKDFREKYFRVLVHLIKFEDSHGIIAEVPPRKKLVKQLFRLARTREEITTAAHLSGIYDQRIIGVLRRWLIFRNKLN